MGPEFMTLPLPEVDGTLDVEGALELILDATADVIAAGPGLGTGDDDPRPDLRPASSAAARRSCSTPTR